MSIAHAICLSKFHFLKELFEKNQTHDWKMLQLFLFYEIFVSFSSKTPKLYSLMYNDLKLSDTLSESLRNLEVPCKLKTLARSIKHIRNLILFIYFNMSNQFYVHLTNFFFYFFHPSSYKVIILLMQCSNMSI